MISDRRSTMTEAAWRSQVMDLAMLHGWRVYAVENSTREIVRRSGARVRVRNVNAAGVGFPDLVMVRARDRRLLFVELKRDKGATAGGGHKVTPDQEAWLEDLRSVSALSRFVPGGESGVDVYVWRPSDLDEVMRVLE